MVALVRVSICIFYFFFLLVGIQPINSARIIGLPVFGRSQYIGIKRIAEELVSRGHEVTIIVSSVQKIKPTKGITHAVYQVPYSQDFLEKNIVASIIKKGLIKDALERLFSNSSVHSRLTVVRTFCEALLNDTKMLDPLKVFDIIITDVAMPCGPLVAEYLGIKRIEYCPYSPRILSVFTPYESLFTLSYIPLYLSSSPRKMNFLQRTKNVSIYKVGKVLVRFVTMRLFQQLKEEYQIKPEISFQESMMNKELTLFLADFALEYPHTILPSYKLIGPLNIQPVKPLPPDLQQLIDSSGDDGFIIVSFGSNVASVLDKEKVEIMAEAFGRLKQKVIWRLQGYIPSSLSHNIKPVEWLPQNDLLAHPKIRLFVSHVGQNSLYEAAYRGVPVAALPLYGDQFDNVELVQEKGLGLRIDYQTLTADDMCNTIQRVIRHPSFKENARRISGLLRDRPRSPVQEAADWIEYTLRHGGLAHLRPYSSQLAWYQYFLVDVVLFLVLIAFIVIMLIKYTG